MEGSAQIASQHAQIRARIGLRSPKTCPGNARKMPGFGVPENTRNIRPDCENIRLYRSKKTPMIWVSFHFDILMVIFPEKRGGRGLYGPSIRSALFSRIIQKYGQFKGIFLRET
jgi:hypothetical protein